MTQVFPFAPRPRAAFRFQPVLDGRAATAVVSWNIGGMRWYVSVYDLDDARVLTLPLVESPDPARVATAAWDGLRGRVVVATASPHGIAPGTKAEVTFAGFAPAGFNGTHLCDALDPYRLAYSLAADPGALVTLGTACAEVNLCGGYFASRMVYRGSARRFEVVP